MADALMGKRGAMRDMAGAVDLTRLREVPGDVARKLAHAHELRSGWRCVTCEERITAGSRWHRVTVLVRNGEPQAVTEVAATCATDACAAPFREFAQVVEAFELEWLDGDVEATPEAGGSGEG